MQILKKVINVIKKMLKTSDHVRLLGNLRFEKAIAEDAIPPMDLQFLRHIIDYLYASKDKYLACTD